MTLSIPELRRIFMSHTIEFVLYPDALGLDITGPLEVFNTASAIVRQRPGNSSGYKTEFAAAEKGPVRLSSGLEILADASFEDRPPADFMLVPGGPGVERAVRDQVVVNYIRKRAKTAKLIVSVCSGAFLLAAAGILDGRVATTHWRVADQLAREYPKVNVRPDAIFVRDGGIYSSAGVTAGIDLALALVEEDLGVSVALGVARLLVVYFRRPGSQSQFSSPLKAQEAASQRFSDLHQWLVKNLQGQILLEQMADFTAMSPRNFSRVFKKSTGLTPMKFLEILRLDRAREILSAGSDSLKSIAFECGFGCEERFRNAFVRRFKVTPSQYRLHFSESFSGYNINPK